MKKFWLFFISLFSIGTYAQVGGLYTYSFLDLPVQARTAALGGTSIAIKDGDINMAAQNPALLSAQTNNAVSASYINFLGQVNYGYLTYGKSFKKAGNFALGLQSIGYGTLSQRDEYGNDLGSFRANDYNFSIMYSKEKDSLLSYGFALKTIYSKYWQYSSVGNAIDAGITYQSPDRLLVLSGVIQNAGRQWKTYTGEREKLPFNTRLGISYKLLHAPFRFILTYDYLNRWDLTYSDPNNPAPTVDPFTKQPIKVSKAKTVADKIGRHIVEAVEIPLLKSFSLRVGFNYKIRKELSLSDKQGIAGFSFGFGVKISKFNFSYAYSQYSPVYGMNSLTLGTNLNSFFKKDSKPAQN